MSKKQVIDELQTMVFAGGNTVTILSSTVLIILGIYQEHQVSTFTLTNIFTLNSINFCFFLDMLL